MIKCPNCDAENLLGAIFCRSCGEKLDIDNLRPDELQSKPKKAAKGAVKIVRNLVLLVILIVVLGGLALTFIPPSIPDAGRFGEDDVGEVQGKLSRLVKGQASTEITEGEASYAARTMLLLTEDDRKEAALERAESGEDPKLLPADAFVAFAADGTTTIILKELIFNRVPIYFTMKVAVVEGDDGDKVSYEIVGQGVGRLPLGGALGDRILQRFENAAHEDSRFPTWETQLFNNVSSVEITDEKATINR